MMNDTAKRRRIKIGLLVSHLEDDFDDIVTVRGLGYKAVKKQ